jgi:hypothetical protein
MTGGQFNLFGEEHNTQDSGISISKVDANRAQIKVIFANEAELKDRGVVFWKLLMNQ